MVARPAAMAFSSAGRERGPAWRSAGLSLLRTLFDGVETRRTGEQEADLAPRRLDEVADGRVFVHAEVVAEDDLSEPQAGQQDLAHEPGPPLPVGRPGHRHRRGDAGAAHGGEERDIGAVVARRHPDDALPAWRTTDARGQAQVGAALIAEATARRIGVAGLAPPRGPRRLVSLTGMQDVF
jgi:hypothetical protein